MMRKEVLLAIFAGVAAGLFLAFGVWKLTNKVVKEVTTPNPNEPQKTQDENQNSDKPKNSQNTLNLTVLSPVEGSVIEGKKAEIKGASKPGSTIVISTLESDYFLKPEENGVFSQEVSLSYGTNPINIYAFDDKGSESVSKLNLYYANDFPFSEKTESLEKPLAYTGSITDILDQSIQIRSSVGGIGQIVLSDEVIVKKNKMPQNTWESIKPGDLAIGDLIIAMGYTKQNSILDTDMVLVIPSQAENSIIAIPATVKSLSAKLLVVEKNNGEDLEISLPKSWVGPDVDDLTKDQKIYIAGTFSEDKFLLRSIFEIL